MESERIKFEMNQIIEEEEVYYNLQKNLNKEIEDYDLERYSVLKLFDGLNLHQSKYASKISSICEEYTKVSSQILNMLDDEREQVKKDREELEEKVYELKNDYYKALDKEDEKQREKNRLW